MILMNLMVLELISFDEATAWVDEGNAVYIAHLDFSKVFDKVLHHLLKQIGEM